MRLETTWFRFDFDEDVNVTRANPYIGPKIAKLTNYTRLVSTRFLIEKSEFIGLLRGT